MFKVELHQHIVEEVNKGILAIQKALKSTKEGAQATSSAGDKHNTEQAMLHLEEEKKSKQLAVALNNKKLLSRIKASQVSPKIGLGSLVETDKGMFYFSVPIGKVSFQQKEVMVLSLASPIGQVFKDKSKDAIITFNGNSFKVTSVL